MTNDFRADLHCHSCFSDGSETPEQLMKAASACGLSALAITDHDTTGAYPQALESAKSSGVLLLNGIEFSASYRGEAVHILGYAYDIKSEAIKSLCERHQERREKRNGLILEKLRSFGIHVTPHELEMGKGSVGRPHIAHVLVAKGVVGSMKEAFERYLGEGKAAYAPGESISVEETIETIRQGKGKAVLAHPHLIKRSTTIRGMLQMPFDGIECYYAKFSSGQEKRWVDLAKQKKWIITGGSDYHGDAKPHNALGSSWVGKETFDLLYAHFLSVNR